MRRRTHPHRAAFSLVELLLVAAIIVVIAGIAVPRYAASMQRYRADSAAARIVRDISLARATARATGAPVEIQFRPAQDFYEIPQALALDDPGTSFLVKLNEPPYSVDLLSADFDGSANLDFDGYGDVQEPGIVILALGDEQRRVIVDGSGVTIEVIIQSQGLVNDEDGGMDMVTPE